MMPTKTTKRTAARRKAETVLVTGATGRLGHRLSRELLKKGITVRALVPLHEHVSSLPAGTIPFVGDINNQESLRAACNGADAVYHFAAIVSQHRFGPSEIMRVNAVGTASVLEAAEHTGVKELIFPSTVDVYGSNRDETLTEETRLRPSDMYGHSKMVAERQIRNFGGPLGYRILRMATIYGSGFEKSFFKVFKLVKASNAYIVGSGKNHLALVHIDDVVRAMFLAREGKHSREIYNLSDGKPHTQESLLHLAAELLGAQKPHKHANVFVVRMLAKHIGLDPDELRFVTSNRVIDISKIRRELSFTPRVSIRAGSKELAEEFLEKYKNTA